MFTALQSGVIGRAISQHHISLHFYNPRNFTTDVHHTVDDRPYGGGPGMVMKVEPLQKAIESARAKALSAKIIYLSPQGKSLKQSDIQQLSEENAWILLCGRYEGIDERIIEQEVDLEISIGDFVVSGGELPAMLLIDAIARTLPGVLGHHESAHHDSFQNGLLDHPCYTRPEIIGGARVPDVLLSGNHEVIARWRLKQSLGKTWQKRPDLLKRRVLNAHETVLLEEFIAENDLISD